MIAIVVVMIGTIRPITMIGVMKTVVMLMIALIVTICCVPGGSGID